MAVETFSPLIFLHIPKTAGTSLSTILGQSLGPHRLCEPFAATRIGEAEAISLERFDVISGHISRADQRRLFPHRRIITVLREPIDRCLSWIYYVRSLTTALGNEANSTSIGDFITTNEMARRNLYDRMVRQLGGHVLDEPVNPAELLDEAKRTLGEAFWVGQQECLADGLGALTRMDRAFHGGLQMVRANVTQVRPQIHDVAPELIAQLQSMNEYDTQLWVWAKENRLCI